MIRRLRPLRLLMPLLVTVFLGCSGPSGNGAANAASAAVKSSDPALWALSDEDTTVYLFGTVHMLKPDVIWFDDEVKAAFGRSDELVLEVTSEDPGEMAQAVALMALNEGPPTRQMLSPQVRSRYLAALQAYEIPAAAMDRIEPWLVAINLSIAPLMKLGYRQDLGVERVLEVAAVKDGKQVAALETTQEQLGFFDSLPREAQVAYLSATVEELPKVKEEFSRLMKAWTNGKPEKLAELMNDSIEKTPELAQALLYDRNGRWTDWIEKRMEQPGTVFMAVGAGHLAGKGSVIELLGERKLKVRRLSKADFGLK